MYLANFFVKYIDRPNKNLENAFFTSIDNVCLAQFFFYKYFYYASLTDTFDFNHHSRTIEEDSEETTRILPKRFTTMNGNELEPMWLTHRVISDRVHRLLVTLSYFRPDIFVQLLSLIPILILLLYLLVPGCLTSLC